MTFQLPSFWCRQTELKMPVWTPGSYLIREYARQVQQFGVANAAGFAFPVRLHSHFPLLVGQRRGG